jgi:aminoglycoside 6'-N-acetyltransferase I
MSSVAIRPARTHDRNVWVSMRHALWPDQSPDELGTDALQYFANSHRFLAQVLVAERAGEIVGMIELSVRSVADGCQSSPVPYIEGWFVASQARREGVGAALIRAGEDWARSKGFNEIASDALLENQISEAAHKALGYEEVCRSIVFRKSLA